MLYTRRIMWQKVEPSMANAGENPAGDAVRLVFRQALMCRFSGAKMTRDVKWLFDPVINSENDLCFFFFLSYI